MYECRKSAKKERTRAIVIASFEIVLGATMVFIGFRFLSATESFKYALYELEKLTSTPIYVVGLLKAALAGSLATGFFAFVHGVKRAVDNLLNAWAKSAILDESK